MPEAFESFGKASEPVGLVAQFSWQLMIVGIEKLKIYNHRKKVYLHIRYQLLKAEIFYLAVICVFWNIFSCVRSGEDLC